mmetsp:Transcript_29718/g.33340  ORF Transcript_29718/g.33340 Transcript_29718/m.33340 type:complete len:118 (-) Transcript_29718:220-573(-)
MKTQNAFDDFWFVGFLAFVFVGGLRVSVPGLEPSTTFDRSSSLWLGNDMPVDMLLPWDDSTVMVARGWGRAGVPPMVAHHYQQGLVPDRSGLEKVGRDLGRRPRGHLRKRHHEPREV